MPDQPLDRPRRRIAQGANRVAFNLPRHLIQHVDFLGLRPALNHAVHHPHHPPRALAARRALAATLMFVELGQPGNRAN